MSQKVTFLVEGMSCQGCARSVAGVLSKALEVEREAVVVELDAKRATVEAPEGADLEQACARLSAQGFPARVIA